MFGAGPDLPYAARLERLIAQRIAVWDVCKAATRPGSLDASIDVSSVVPNDFRTFFRTHSAIGAVFTTLYYMRRTYEEGLAAFGWAGERFAASTNYAKMMYEGMRDHYGIEVENFKVHAYAEEDHGRMADNLLRQCVNTAGQQRRVRRAIEHVLVCRNARTAALNRWLDEPGALRSK